MDKEKHREYIPHLYRIGLFWFNAYIFIKMASYATGFARTWTNAYRPVVSHMLILLFSIGFFIIFSNLTQLVLAIEEKDTETLLKSFKRISLSSVFLLLILLLVQIIPEFLISLSTQY